MPSFTSLPQHLIERILRSGTNTKDKKSLRATCKQLQQTLDDSLVHLHLQPKDERGLQVVEKLLVRLQHVQGLTSIAFAQDRVIGNLMHHLPYNMTSFATQTRAHIDLKMLKTLPFLTSLSLEDGMEISGLQAISGLTSLHIASFSIKVGSVAHLAPTLKRLRIHTYDNVLDMNQLTNLEALEVMQDLPVDFFATHSRLPLQRLCLHPESCASSFNPQQPWHLSPTTLVSLTLSRLLWWDFGKMPRELPQHITHLQLPSLVQSGFVRIVSAIPQLQRLDICLSAWYKNNWDEVLNHLSNLTSLRQLGILVDDNLEGSWSRCKVLSAMPPVAAAVERGVQLKVAARYNDMFDVFDRRSETSV